MLHLRLVEWILLLAKPMLCMMVWYSLRAKPALRAIRWFMLGAALKEAGIMLLSFCLPATPYFFVFWAARFMFSIFTCAMGGLLCMDLSPFEKVKAHFYYLPAFGCFLIALMAVASRHPFQYPDALLYDIRCAVFAFGTITIGILFSVHKAFKFQAFGLWALLASQLAIASFTLRGYGHMPQLVAASVAVILAAALCSGPAPQMPISASSAL